MIKETLFAQYILEREGSQILEDAEGFIIYKINGEECFIVDMYTAKASRPMGKCKELISKLSEIVRKQNCKIITANIQIQDKRALHTLLASHGVGFKLVRAHNDVLLIMKELKGE